MDLQPYCGSAPAPADLWARWNLDPWLLTLLIVAAGMHLVVIARSEPESLRRRSTLWATGWGTLALLFVSPLCALTSALFAARVAHHAILVAVVPPLLVLALPPRLRLARLPGTPIVWAGCHALLMWFWHAPGPYAASLSSDAVYWLSELSLLGSAILLWHALLSPLAWPVSVLIGYLVTIIQMGLLGAIITFARAPLYWPHFTTAEAWGLTPLADQQLAGLIMWVPSALPYLIAALVYVGGQLHRISAAR